MDRMTAAHQNPAVLTPLCGWTTSTTASRSRFRINDRGPFVKNRIIDLSRSAATAIGMIGPGTARVRLAILEVGEHIMSGPITPMGELAGAPCVGGGYFAVQVGSFSVLENAQRMRGKVELAYGAAAIHKATVEGRTVYRVLLGRFGSRDSARDTINALTKRRDRGVRHERRAGGRGLLGRPYVSPERERAGAEFVGS